MKKLIPVLVFMIITAGDAAQAASTKIRTLDPPPAPGEAGSLAAQLKRFRGQTQFLNPGPYYFDGPMPRPMPGSDQKAGQPAEGGKREQEESDVFKVGLPGSKL